MDDSQAYRNLLSRELEKDPEVEVVSRAVNGRLALPRIKHYRPDFVVMDQEMPEMNGLETLEVVREKWPETAVIMFSSHTVEGARTTLRALQLGAVDFVAKPSAEEDIGAYLRRHLVSRIKAIAKERRAAHPELAASKLAPHPPDPGVSSALSDICAIGISTGGPAALRELLSKVPAAIRGSIVIVQHMPPIFTQQLAESLAQSSGLNVVEGAEGMTLTPGLVVIAPGGFHMEVVHDGQRAR
ncbi:MAG: response regulator, partial [Spirochaetia bacterium]|nr:response regulator [Spirochaetia bacterium]